MKKSINGFIMGIFSLAVVVHAGAPIGSEIKIVAENGRYVSAFGAGNVLAATQAAPGPYETFEVVDAGDGAVALKCTGNNLYVVAEGGGSSPLEASRSAIGAWEKFMWVDAGKSFGLLALANNKYVSAKGSGSLIPEQAEMGGTESFRLDTAPIPPYKDPSTPIDERIQDLIGRMTLAEKVDQLAGKDKLEIGHDGIPGNTRLGIPSFEIGHGPFGFKGWFDRGWDIGGPIKEGTYFPVSTAMAATWDKTIVSNMTACLAREMRAAGCWLNAGPAMNIIRDPRGGRSFEYFTEDPYLNGQIATAYTRGLQSERVAANLKHFVANNQELNRHTLTANVDERTLREIYFPGFKAAIQQGGAWSVMNAYNKVNGIYCAENKFLLTDVLRTDWGFNGFVLSDWSSVHSTAPSANAGMDVEMPKDVYYGQKLIDAVNDGQVAMETLDTMVANVLRVLFWSGAFDESPSFDESLMHAAPHIAAAREGSGKSMVLLKNNGDVLPFDPSKTETIAVIGPNAHYGEHFRSGDFHVQLLQGGGSAALNVERENLITPYDGIVAQVGDSARVSYAPGCYAETGYGSASWDTYMRDPSGKPGLYAEYFDNESLSGTPFKTETTTDFTYTWYAPLNIPDIGAGSGSTDRWSVRFSGTLTPPVSRTYTFAVKNYSGNARIYINNKRVATIDNGRKRNYSGEGSIELKAGVQYDVRLEYIKNSGNADVHFGWDYENVVWLKEAKALAGRSDVVVLCVGLSGMMGEVEDGDRAELELPPMQEHLIREITASNPDTAVAIVAGSAITMDDWLHDADALIMAWYPGEQGGNALYDVVFGDRNPSGRLPITFPQSLDQYPADQYTRSKDVNYSEGVYVGYRYFDKENKTPLFPFGHGLSYTRFEYSNLVIEPEVRNGERIVNVSLTVKNTGHLAGDEVVQLYVHDPVCSLDRPEKELKEFALIHLDSGESKTVSFSLGDSAFAFFDDAVEHDWKVEAGDFEIRIGRSSADLPLSGRVRFR